MNLLFNRNMILSLVLLGSLLVPGIWLHEYAHAAVCLLYEVEPEITIKPMESRVMCDFDSMNVNWYLYWAAGGIVTGLVFVIPLAFRRIRRHVWTIPPLAAIVVGQAFTAYVETMYHELYILWHGYVEIGYFVVVLAVFVYLVESHDTTGTKKPALDSTGSRSCS